jgi:hypothetical protein
VHDNSLNAAPATQNIALSGIGISPISVLPSNSTLASGTVGIVYPGVTFTASGGTGPYSFTHTGSLPPGLTLSGLGVLAGTPNTASGPYSFTVIATDVHSVSGSRSYALTINLGTATVTLGDLAQTYTGSPRAVAVTTNPPELNVNVVYTGTGGTSYGPSSTPPTLVGSYTIVGTVSDENYTGTNTGTLVISEPNATVALDNLSQTYTGSPLPATATTTPANLTVHFIYTGTNGTSYGPSSTPPTGAGSYTVVGAISSEIYSGTATGTLAIAKAAATVTLGSLLQTYTGSALAATATTNPSALIVNLTYAGSPSAPIAAGSYAVVGAVSDPNYVGTSSGTLMISPATSTAVVVSNSNPAAEQSAVKFTATVSSSAGTPSGTVKFLDGTTDLGSETLSSSAATLTTSSLTAGTHEITAVYTGATNYASSTSAAVKQAVLNFNLTPGSGGGGSGGSGSSGSGGSAVTSQTVAPGGVATYPLTVAPTAGTIFPTPVTLTVTGMPVGATAVITPSSWKQLTSTSWSFPANTPLNALSLAIQLPSSSARFGPNALPRGMVPAFWGILLLPWLGRMRRQARRLRGRAAWLLLLALSVGLAAGISCSSSGFFAPQGQTYTVLVTATSGPLTHSTTLTLTVTSAPK